MITVLCLLAWLQLNVDQDISVFEWNIPFLFQYLTDLTSSLTVEQELVYTLYWQKWGCLPLTFQERGDLNSWPARAASSALILSEVTDIEGYYVAQALGYPTAALPLEMIYN